MNPILSIVIPTKNRQKYCIEAIKTVVALNDERVEIVIQDNSDEKTLESQIASNGWNVVYNYHEGVISFVDNFSEAVEKSSGKFLCVIGDDDGVLPNIVQMTEMMDKQNIDCLVPGLYSIYAWPSEKPFFKNAENGYLQLTCKKNKFYEISCAEALSRLLKNAGQDYQNLHLPRLYHGIVRRSCLDVIKEKTGAYFNGLTPDIYNAVALSLVSPKTVVADFPITVSGMCPKSGSADSATGRHTGSLADAPHFRGHDSYTWDEKIPAVYSVESIWAETVVHALRDFGREDLCEQFNVAGFDRLCYAVYPQFAEEIQKHASDHGVSRGSLLLSKMTYKPKMLIKKCARRVFGTKNSYFYNVYDITDAIRITVENFEKIDTSQQILGGE